MAMKMSEFAPPSISRNLYQFVVAACVAAILSGSLEASVLDEVRTAWQRREQLSESLTIHWTTRLFAPKGTWSDFDPRSRAIVLAPPDDVWVTRHYRLAMSGNRMKFSADEEMWSFDLRRVVRHERHSTYDGRSARTLETANQETGTPDSGGVGPLSSYMEFSFGPVSLLRAILRGASEEFRLIDLNDATISPGMVEINGVQCLELSVPAANTRNSVHVYVDPIREYAIVQTRMMASGKTTQRYNVRYENDPVLGVRPAQWDVVAELTTPAGRRSITQHSMVTAFELNRRTADEEFQLKFPVGTVVTDRRTGERFVVSQTAQLREAMTAKATWRRVGIALAIIVAVVAIYAAIRMRRPRSV